MGMISFTSQCFKFVNVCLYTIHTHIYECMWRLALEPAVGSGKSLHLSPSTLVNMRITGKYYHKH